MCVMFIYIKKEVCIVISSIAKAILRKFFLKEITLLRKFMKKDKSRGLDDLQGNNLIINDQQLIINDYLILFSAYQLAILSNY